MGDMGEVFRGMKKAKQHRKAARLEAAQAEDDGKWHQHTLYHWSRTLCGDRLDYWPSTGKWMWRGKVYHGDSIYGFMANRERDEENPCPESDFTSLGAAIRPS